MEAGFQAGRPRDPGMEARVYGAAVRIFAEHGWAGFNFAAVAREARVGRSALYRRWETPAELAIAAIESHIVAPESIDTGSFRGDLIRLASSMIVSYAGQAGLAPLRLFTETNGGPENLRALQRRISETRVRAAKAAVERGIARGEVDGSIDVQVVVDMIGGAIISHVLLTPRSRWAKTRRIAESHAARIIDTLLVGIAQTNR